MPKLIQYLSSRWLLGEVMCKISYFAQNMTYTASIMLLTVIAIERYIAVLHPLRSKCIVTETRLVIAQNISTNRNTHPSNTLPVKISIWVLSAAYNSPDIHNFTVFRAEDPISNGTVSFCLPIRPITNSRNYYSINFVVWYILPLGVMIFMYTKVCCALWQSGKLTCHNSQNTLLLRPVSCRDSTPTRQETVLCYEGSVTGVQTRTFQGSSFSNKGPQYKSKAQNNNVAKRTGSWHIFREASRKGNKVESPSPDETDQVILEIEPPGPDQQCFPGANPGNKSSHQQPKKARRYLSCDYTSEGDATSSEDGEKAGNSVPATPEARRAKGQYRMHSLRVMSSRRRVIKLLVVVMVTFAVCVFPTHLMYLLLYWEIYPTPETTYDVLSPLSYVMLYGNSALNPILYWLFSDMFKQSLGNKICCKKK
ncbi:trissin receptor [Biomphalaria pfeifferi]|uniref:Trissin receptor n=1 Tax=Biomphalaria pfeifferi TaxID=112525 RepID=A0AAD8C992_BIOPF|nr:trissin receptor [Biomphalaria pfeifferi]